MMGGSRSRSRSPSRRGGGGGGGMDRRRSRSRSPRDRDRDRRYRPDRGERRSRSPPRHRPRSPPRRNMRSRSRSRSRERKDFNRDKPTTSRPPVDESELEGKTEEEIEMMRIMGFSQFDTTKGKPVTGANASSVNIIHKRKYRQYMNRKGGFNRPLDFVA